MAESKKTVKEVEKEVENKVKKTAKKVADKVQSKAPAKKQTEEAVVEAAAAAEAPEAKNPVKKIVVKKPSVKKAAPKMEVVLQYAGKEIFYADLVKKAVQISKKALKKQGKEVKDVKVYVKPEENMAYYVANGGDDIGSFQI